MFDEIPQLKLLNICYDCVGDTYLSALIEHNNNPALCVQCGEKDPAISYQELAEVVDEAFKIHYYRTTDQMSGYEYAMHRDDEIDYSWEQDGESAESIVAEQVGIAEDCALDITKILAYNYFDMEMAKMGEPTEYSDDAKYEPKRVDSFGLHDEWRIFRDRVEKDERYFSEASKAYLDSIFGDIETLVTRNRGSVIAEINPGDENSVFYRGRIFHSEKNVQTAMIRPDLEIGPTPPSKAASGRMNAKGISVFYGATDPEISLSELRPPVGSSVIMGEFKLVRPVRLLDLNLLSEVIAIGSIFDPEFERLEARSHFLTSLVQIMTRPTNPWMADEEYLPTQLIADYIANAHPAKLDGILFPSSQSKVAGYNVVLFRRASHVKPIEIGESSDIDTKTYEQCGEDEYERHYSVTEWAPKEEEAVIAKEPIAAQVVERLMGLTDTLIDEKNYTLEINLENLKVRIIEESNYPTDDYTVRRYKYEKLKPKEMPF